ncbi:GL12437 [Drosophila persimilis]|uniref:GL12437 n=1 Tax=Drosophila persimilis TaxID=7234 RepID=B4GMS1_DROPE|nr:GL12437 [Drosophila persimilis]
MSDEVKDDNAAGEGSQQIPAEAEKKEEAAADRKGGSEANIKVSPTAVSKEPSQSGSRQLLEDSKPQTSEKQNSDKDKQKNPENKQNEPHNDRDYWELGRGIVFFCFGSFVAWMLTEF